jgi:hypothetical protein
LTGLLQLVTTSNCRAIANSRTALLTTPHAWYELCRECLF